jgi:hypothetical protein
MREGLRFCYALLYDMSVFNVLADVRHSRVKDITQAVFTQILLRNYPVHLGELILRVHPKSAQLGYTAKIFLSQFERLHEFLEIEVAVFKNSNCVWEMLIDKVEDCLAIIFGYVFCLT